MRLPDDAVRSLAFDGAEWQARSLMSSAPDTARRAKVAHIATSDLSLRYLLKNQMLAIRRAGHQVIGISAPGPDVHALDAAGIPHVPVPLTRRVTPLTDLKALIQLVWILRRERIDVVHTHTPKASLIGQYAALLAGVPVRVHTIHGLYFPAGISARKRRLFVLLERLTMRFSAWNFSQNPEDVPTAIEEGICAPDRLEVLGNGIDLEAFQPEAHTPEKRAATRAELGLRPEHLVVGMVSRLVEEKGYREMFEAVRRVRKTIPLARYIFIGGTQHEKSDRLGDDCLEQEGIADVAQLLGHRDDVARLYAAMDVLAHPSHREGFPRVPMEASAMGLPVVATEIRGNRQVVEDGVTGRLVPLKDAAELSRAMIQLLSDSELRQRLGGAARKKAKLEFDERKIFERVVKRYDELLATSMATDHGLTSVLRRIRRF